MIKPMQRLLTIICAFLALLCLTGTAYAIPAKSDKAVNDYAGVLPDSAETDIAEMAVTLKQKTTAEVIVVTVESLEGKDIESYANELAREWAIGAKDKDNGVVILFALNDRKVRIEVGRGLEGALNDAKAGRILDNFAVP
ncbi:MAG TPA: TPM domain-containing protein, partial [Clostridia bacterium]|nr:TPM domain-containing protein [Clostridia bacterium]